MSTAINVQSEVEVKPADRRAGARAGFMTDIVIEAGSSQIQSHGSVYDLSLGGVFINTRQTLAVGTGCRINIALSGTSHPIVLKVEGRVVQTGDSGMGIAFESMDLDSYAHLKNIVRYNLESENRE